MKTVLHRNEDGYEIVLGFRDAVADPVATFAKIQSKVLALPELAQCSSVKTKISAQMQIAADNWILSAQAEKSAAQAEKNGDASEKARCLAKAASYLAIRNAALAAIPLLEDELKPLTDAFEQARAALFETNASYFTPGPGEYLLSDKDYTSLAAKFDSLAETEALLVDGSTVADYRGRAYWIKGDSWEKGSIGRLGETLPSGALWDRDITEAQRAEIADGAEAERIAGLSTEERAAERSAVLQSIAQNAVNKKQVAEITGEAFDAAAWYAEKKAEIERKYA